MNLMKQPAFFKHEHRAIDLHAIVSATDARGHIIYVNDKFCAVSGYSRDELLGQHHRIVKSGMHPPGLYRDMWRTISSGDVWHGELCNRRKDGSLYWVESTITPILDDQGVPRQYLSVRTDITHIKMVEANLRRQRELQHLITDATVLLLNTRASHTDTAIAHILQRSGEFLEADCARLFLHDEQGVTLINTHEWCAPGIEPCIQTQGLSLADAPWWQEQIAKDSYLLVTDAADLPDGWSVERQWLEARNIRSLFAIPLQQEDRTLGFLSFEAFTTHGHWQWDDIRSFTVLASALASAINRQRTEQSLEQHRERLRRSQIHANIGTWDWHLQTGQMFWTERTAPLLGYPEGDVETTYATFLQAVHPDDQGRVLDAVDTALRSEDSYEIECRVIWPDGSQRWLLKRGAVVRDADGNALHMLGIIQDIDSRKRAELALAERERQLREAQAIAHMGSWEADFTTHTLRWSEETYRILGRDPATFTPTLKNFRHLVHPDDLTNTLAAVKEAMKSNQLDFNCRICHPDGTIRHIHILARLEKDQHGHPLHYAGTVQDITEMTEAQARLMESEQRLSFAVEGAGDGIWDWDLATGRMAVSSHFETMLGYQPGEIDLSDYTPTTAVHPDHLPQVKRILAKPPRHTLSNGFDMELRLRCKDGSYKWVQSRASVVTRDAQGNPLRVIGINSDISERKRVEEALIAARVEADRANRAKSEFLSSMSHELRTPLNAILGFGQLLESDDSLDPQQLDSVHEILKAGHHLLDLINEVLDLAKVESGRIELALAPLDVASIVRECLGLVSPIASQHGITVSHHINPGLRVRADHTRLKQALVNLMSNAIKYNRPQGNVVLSAHVENQDHLRLVVRDTGPGIPPDRIHELFQPFNRLDAEHSDVEGTGIGLTITERLVEMMGGTIGVDSQLGIGSAFWIELPLEQGTASDTHELPPLPALPCSGGSDDHHLVLYIEDNPANLKLVSQLIGRRRHVGLITASDGESGIDRAQQQCPDLILLDINMPGMDGYQVLEALRTNIALRHIPVVAITANAMPRDILRGMAARFDDYLTKPIDTTRLFALLDRFLSNAKGATS